MPRLQKPPISGKKSKNAAKFEKTKKAVVEAGVEVVTGEANVAEVRVGAVREVCSGIGGVSVGAHLVLIADAVTAAVGHDLDPEAMEDDAPARAVVGDEGLGLIPVEGGVLIPALAVTAAAANDAAGAFHQRVVRVNPQDSNLAKRNPKVQLKLRKLTRRTPRLHQQPRVRNLQVTTL